MYRRGLLLDVTSLGCTVAGFSWTARPSARAFVRLRGIARFFDRWGHRLAPAVLVALGLYILFDAGVPALVGGVFRSARGT
jgi:cadmium resistance protein CadD (predicted permease)